MRLVRLLLIVAAVLVGLAGVIFLAVRQSSSSPRSDRREAFATHNRALADLENGRFAESLAPLRELIAEFPAEPAPLQNLAVAGLSIMQTADRIADPAAYEAGQLAAQDGLEGMSTLDADRVTRLRLLGEYYTLTGDDEKAAKAFTEAAYDAQSAPDLWFEATRAAERADDAAAARAFERAIEAEPRNVFLLSERLQREGRAIASLADDDPEAAKRQLDELVRFTQAVLAPLRPLLKDQNGFDIDQTLAEAQADPASASRPLRKVALAIAAQPIAKSDRLDIDRDLLEFVAVDLSPAFFESLEGPAESPVDVPAIAASKPLGQIDPDAVVTPADLDRDGRPELLVASGGTLRIALLTDPSQTLSSVPLDAASDNAVVELIAVDLDNDFDLPAPVNPAAGVAPCRTADLDVIVRHQRSVTLFRNDDGTLVRAFDLIPESDRTVDALAVADLDADGDLDIATFDRNVLHVHLSRGSLDEPSLDSPLPVLADGLSGIVELHAVDLDGDFDLDLVGRRRGPRPLGWFENLRHGLLRWRTLAVSLGPGGEATGVAVTEATGDGVWDLALAAGPSSQLIIGGRPQPGRFGEAATRRLPAIAGEVRAIDLNLDGLPELIAREPETGESVIVSGLNQPRPKIEPASPAFADAVAVVDPLGDGGRELLIAQPDGRLATASLDGVAGDHRAVRVTLLAEQVKDGDGQPSGRVNAYGVGSVLQLRAGERTITRQVDGPVTTLGLADREQAESIRILWTNGIPSHIIEPAAGVYVCEEQRLKGSCPYAYGWDGERFVFLTDLLWAAPIGLRDAAGELMQPRPWEHLLVEGDRMRPRRDEDGSGDGSADAEWYELRITEELWEAAYFDRVALSAVDHPPEVAIATNEKVGPPALAEPLLHVIRKPSPLAAATLDGRDVTDGLRTRDDRYVRGYVTKRMQGLVDPAMLDLTFEPLANGPHTLVLTGWMRPTDTSLNVGLAQRGLAPQPPSIEVVRRDGSTRQQPFVGFPGGKTKTIAVPLGDDLDPDAPRVRIRSSMELAWDTIALAPTATEPFDLRGDDQGEAVVTPCELLTATLRTRGVSAMHSHSHGGPERFDYAEIHPSPWRPMAGRFTRLGDVADLIAEADDRLAVIGSGDEIVIRFAVPPQAAGTVRDFVLSCDGYDKDADLNTVTGDSSEPYPIRRAFYPTHEPVESRADAAYQTRRMDR